MTNLPDLERLVDAYGACCWSDGSNDQDHPDTAKARAALIEYAMGGGEMSKPVQPSSPEQVCLKMLLWMFVTPLFISWTLTDFWRPCTYTQALCALWAVHLTCRLLRPWCSYPYYMWWHDRRLQLPPPPQTQKENER